jgi:hypothetical protein
MSSVTLKNINLKFNLYVKKRRRQNLLGEVCLSQGGTWPMAGGRLGEDRSDAK